MKLSIKKTALKSLTSNKQLAPNMTPNIAGGAVGPDSSYAPTEQNDCLPTDTFASSPGPGQPCNITGIC
ncbi:MULTISPECIES: hypothetical protein [Pseudoalteromonas]|uniref:hypothetical protein n=1 Tax=Pseudoalteromonas TaxID=53246 RepID=UPI000FFE9B45|nr:MULTISPECIES: hypothetical protein [Pseudoalteromonas]MCG9759097.1 hypothetical protein [Pseudoalteromonas sp. Isolate6]NKC18990.1 hypothetical protein [Pseudoalteromonas galatheae]RXE87386.1 hypothetical protein DRB05_06920 [Pseudoalteromonas sp. A757]